MATSTNTIYGPLRRASRGASVTLLQQRLNQRVTPSPRLSPDGDFGNETDRAVKTFQAFNRLKVDGVVGLRTAAALGLGYQDASHVSGGGAQPPAFNGGGGAAGGQAPAPWSPPSPPPPPPSPNPQITRVKSFFPCRSNWTFSSSAGIAASVAMISGGGGKLWLQNNSADSGMLYFGGIGGCIGITPLPSFTWSTKDMWSTGVGCLLTRTTDNLEFSDLQGFAVVASLGAAAQLSDDGVSLNGSIYFLGIPVWRAPALIGPQGIFVAAQNATAMGMMVGTANGLDTGGPSMWIGGAA